MDTRKTRSLHEDHTLNPIQQRLRDDIRVAEAKIAKRLRRFPFYATVESASHTTVLVDGHPLINLGSNNYLGLSTDPRVIEAATEATRFWGTGVTGSRLLNGTLRLHESLEATLCGFYGKEAALVFPTGYTANLGLISGALQPGDIIAVDREIHASLLDALMLSRAPFRRFEHNSVDGARSILERGNSARARALVLEGVYSMQGDVPPLAQFATLADEANAFLIVDEAHGMGVVGPRGRGGAELAGVLDRVDALTVTFSKSLASCGGAIVGSRDMIDALRLKCRPFMFTASNTPGSIAAAECALRILIDEPQMLSELQGRTEFLRAALMAQGISVPPSRGAILTVRVGSDFQTLQAWRMLRNRGVFCNPVLTPAVPQGKGLLRLSIMRTHTEANLEQAAAAFGHIGRWIEQSGDQDVCTRGDAVTLPASDSAGTCYAMEAS